jgi:hypothetical protein
MTALIELLTEAREAGLTLARIEGARGEDDTLRVRGPRSADALVRELLTRKDAVLTAIAVYDGSADRLDWRRERILDDFQPCALCRRPTLLIEPYDGRPCHKTCAEAAVRWGTAHAARSDGGRAA